MFSMLFPADFDCFSPGYFFLNEEVFLRVRDLFSNASSALLHRKHGVIFTRKLLGKNAVNVIRFEKLDSY